jgi:ABC-type Mn2+/Zn2+ transport system permease subunit
VNPATGNFLKDILSDATGVTLHRFQMLVWTVVLGIVFALQVYRNLAMMDFSPELLALQGISGGTYLSFKVPETPAISGGAAP